MKTHTIRADILLFITAAIWGFAFVAQRVGMDHVGPLTFNGVRFALGALALIPLVLRMEKGRTPGIATTDSKKLAMGGGILGLALFFGSTFQQVGLAGPQLAELGLEALAAALFSLEQAAASQDEAKAIEAQIQIESVSEQTLTILNK